MTTKRKEEEIVTEYPVIYTYIYEREGQDIKRLSKAYKNVKPKKNVSAPKTKVIVGIEIHDGIPKPIYKEMPNAPRKTPIIASQKTVKELVSKKTAIVKRVAPKKTVAKRSTKK